jgi:lysophospholipase L1-like esterase
MMKQVAVTLLLLAAAPVAAQPAQPQDWANLGRYRDANRVLVQVDPRRVVFMGDSITEFWGKEPFIRDNAHFVDRGISGQTAPQMLVRFQSDVVALKPAVVHIMAGTNDIAQNTGPETEAEMMGYIVSMAQIAQANHVKVIIGSIPPASDFPWRQSLHPASAIKALNARLKAYAERQGFIYADYWSVLASEDNGLKPQYSEDRVHPNAAGYEAMRPTAQAAIERAFSAR